MNCIERSIGGLVVRIDRDLCVGFGDCIDVLAELFELDDDGVVRFRDGAADPGKAALIEACRACPVDALTLLDRASTPVAP
jgi:ferredoxin